MDKVTVCYPNLLGVTGFELNRHSNGGRVIVLPLHKKGCSKVPCACGADDAMPVDIVNCNIIWPEPEIEPKTHRNKSVPTK